MKPLKFAKGNAKLGKKTAIFSLPAGFTCPAALLCFSRADKLTGHIKDGPHTQFRCYAASGEALFKNVRKSRWNNFEALKGKSIPDMVHLLNTSIPKKGIELVRFHSSGDFFNQDYFDAWLEVARLNPTLKFYGYTKALPFWIARKDVIPSNFYIVASYGGRYDNLIEPNKLRSARVVGVNPNESPEQEAKRLGLKIDHDDSLVWKSKNSFAISLHGTQPAGSPAGKAWHKIKTTGKGGYKTEYFEHYKVSGKLSPAFLAIKRERDKERVVRKLVAV